MSDGVSLLQNGSREASRHRKGMSAKAQLEGIGRPLGDTFSFKDIFYHRWAETIHSSPLSPIPPMCVDWTGLWGIYQWLDRAPQGATRRSSGGAATTSRLRAEPSRGCRWRNRDESSHDASFPSELLRRLGAALSRERGGDDLLERLHLGYGRDADARRLDDVDGMDADARRDVARRRGVVLRHVGRDDG